MNYSGHGMLPWARGVHMPNMWYIYAYIRGYRAEKIKLRLLSGELYFLNTNFPIVDNEQFNAPTRPTEIYSF